MKFNIPNDKWRLFGIVALISYSVPLLIALVIIVSSPGKESVVFLEDAPLFVGLNIFTYYILLTGVCIYWFFRRVFLLLTLKNVTVKNELQHLNSQVNPHFFFNMLNSLYGLVGTDPTKAQQLILKLSDLMRYSIYEGQKDWVTIGEEVSYLENYLSLHQDRYHKETDIKLEVEVTDEDLKVMPLLLITLVENAFKHGVEQLREDAFIHIQLSATASSLRFEVINNFDAEQTVTEGGIGLENLKQRLAIRYPKKHTLTLHAVANVYQAVLILPQLSS